MMQQNSFLQAATVVVPFVLQTAIVVVDQFTKKGAQFLIDLKTKQEFSMYCEILLFSIAKSFLNTQDTKGNTILHQLILANRSDFLNALLSQAIERHPEQLNAAFLIQNKNNQTPFDVIDPEHQQNILHVIMFNSGCFGYCCRFLGTQDFLTYVKKQDQDGDTVLHQLIQFNRVNSFHALFAIITEALKSNQITQKKLNEIIGIRNKKGETFFHILDATAQNALNYAMRDPKHFTLLCEWLIGNQPNLFWSLLQQQDQDGDTVLHQLIQFNRADSFHALFTIITEALKSNQITQEELYEIFGIRNQKGETFFYIPDAIAQNTLLQIHGIIGQEDPIAQGQLFSYIRNTIVQDVLDYAMWDQKHFTLLCEWLIETQPALLMKWLEKPGQNQDIKNKCVKLMRSYETMQNTVLGTPTYKALKFLKQCFQPVPKRKSSDLFKFTKQSISAEEQKKEESKEEEAYQNQISGTSEQAQSMISGCEAAIEQLYAQGPKTWMGNTITTPETTKKITQLKNFIEKIKFEDDPEKLKSIDKAIVALLKANSRIFGLFEKAPVELIEYQNKTVGTEKSALGFKK